MEKKNHFPASEGRQKAFKEAAKFMSSCVFSPALKLRLTEQEEGPRTRRHPPLRRHLWKYDMCSFVRLRCA